MTRLIQDGVALPVVHSTTPIECFTRARTVHCIESAQFIGLTTHSVAQIAYESALITSLYTIQQCVVDVRATSGKVITCNAITNGRQEKTTNRLSAACHNCD